MSEYIQKLHQELQSVDSSLSDHLTEFAEFLIRIYSMRPSKILRVDPGKGIETMEEAKEIIRRLSREVRFLEEVRDHLQDRVNGSRRALPFFGW